MQLLCPDAPFEVEPKLLGGQQRRARDRGSGPAPKHLSWWLPNPESTTVDLEPALVAVARAWNVAGAPPDVAIGFSQGAALLGALLAPGPRARLGNAVGARDVWTGPRANVFFTGYEVGVADGRGNSAETGARALRNAPSLHCHGLKDQVVHFQSVSELASAFADPPAEVMRHRFGHRVPGSDIQCMDAVAAWIVEMADFAS